MASWRLKVKTETPKTSGFSAARKRAVRLQDHSLALRMRASKPFRRNRALMEPSPRGVKRE